MARMIPPRIAPDYPNEGEKEIFQLLKNDPNTKDWIVLHSLDIANHGRQIAGETDFLVIVPGMGVLVLEVKGCHKIRREGGEWFYGNDPVPDSRGPFKQAADAMYIFRKRLEEKSRKLGEVLFSYAVVFPFIEFHERSSEWNQWQIINHNSLKTKSISELVCYVLANAKSLVRKLGKMKTLPSELNIPTPEQCNQIANYFRPDFECYESPNARKYRLIKELKFYTEEQFEALDAIEANPRVAFTGPAGTGKTLLAIETARRASNDGRRVLFLCYNKLLAEMLKKETADLSLVICRTIHDHMMEISNYQACEEDTNTEEFWTRTLPQIALEKARENNGLGYDELILDEAQDILCQPSYIGYLDSLLKGGISEGTWRFFGDFEQQTIYGKMPVNLKKLLDDINGNAFIYSLRVNCRNTRKIAALAKSLGGMNPDYKRILRSEESIQPELFFYKDNEHQRLLLIQELENLYEKGYKGSSIAILSRHSDKRCIASTILTSPWNRRLMPMKDINEGGVRYSSIFRFKGLESPAIIVTEVDDISSESSKALLYVAVTRALHSITLLINEKIKSEVEKALTVN